MGMFDAYDKDIIRQSVSATSAPREFIGLDGINRVEIKLVNDGDPGKVARRVAAALAYQGPLTTCGKTNKPTPMCLNCNAYPRLSPEANFCTRCSATGCNADPIAVQKVFYEGARVVQLTNEPRWIEDGKAWAVQCCDMAFVGAPDTSALYCSFCDSRLLRPDNPPLSTNLAQVGATTGRIEGKDAVLTINGVEYPIAEIKASYPGAYDGGFSIPRNALDGVSKSYKELAEKLFESMSIPVNYTPRGPILVSPAIKKQYDDFVASGAFDSVAGFEDPASWDEFCLLSEELFDDLLWDEALEKAEGREDRRTGVLDKMWSRPEYAEVRALCEAKAARIVGRRC